MGFKKLANTNHIGLMHPRQTILVTTFPINIIPLAWNLIISRNPPIVGISVSPLRFSHNLIKDQGEFTINIPTSEILKKLMYCGQISGKKVNKFKETGLTSLDGINVKCPRIKECICHIECKLIDSKVYGDHTLFIGKVVTCLGNEDFLKNNRIDVRKVEIPYHLTGRNFTFNQKKIYRV